MSAETLLRMNASSEVLEESGLSTADAVYEEIIERRRELEGRVGGDWMQFNTRPPRVVGVEEVDGNTLVTMDVSGQQGGSFKYYSAVGALVCVSKGVQRVYTASAGNYSNSLGEACNLLELPLEAHVPSNLNAVKRDRMTALGIRIVDMYDDVPQAVEAADLKAEADSNGVFLHPYNNPDGIAGLTILTDQVLTVLGEMHYSGELNLRGHNVQYMTQRGGGSLIAAMATSVYAAKDAGMPYADDFSVEEVRPRRLANGSLNPFYDGLCVDKPGSYSAPFLVDESYVAGHHVVELSSVGNAALRAADYSAVQFESNALAGLGASLEQSQIVDRPTIFVSLLTGRNTTNEQQHALTTMPVLEKVSEQPDNQLMAARRAGHVVLSGATTRRLVISRHPS